MTIAMRCFVCLLVLGVVRSFAPLHTIQHQHGLISRSPTSSTTSLNELPFALQEIINARFCFWMCFFGATGAATSGRYVIPIVFTKYKDIQSLKGQGKTLGGETVGLPQWVGYPEDVSVKDVEQVLNNRMTPDAIVRKYPEEGLREGFLTYDSFALANKNNNPLAAWFVFDSFANGSRMVSPITAQQLLDSYKTNFDQIKARVVSRKVLGVVAFVVLLGLVGGADTLAAYHAWVGWFPEWPGGFNFPACLVDPETGPWTIPKYWMSDLPTV